MQCLEKDPARRPRQRAGNERPAGLARTGPGMERGAGGAVVGAHRPPAPDARPVAAVLLSQEGHELRIGPRLRPRG